MALLNSGVFSYNGVSFVALYKSKVEVKPVKDSARRALVAREYTIDVEGRIAALDLTTDAQLATMRIALEKPAGALIYTGKGFGPLNVNVAGGVRDAAYGPWPEVLSWDPIGNDQGCLVRWKCTTQLPCEENPFWKGILEYCWSESWDIDEDGYTTRTIEGHLTIQATRLEVDARVIPDNADAYLAQAVPDLPVGFRRTQNRKLSEDKRTLEFQFKDEEMAQPLPTGVTTADVRHKVSWRRPEHGKANSGTQTISGTLTLPARTPKAFIYDKILMILRSRWGNAAPAISAQPNGLTYLLDSIELDDEVFGRSTSFSATVRVIGAMWPSQLLQSSGLWNAIPNTDFVSWKLSVFGLTGRAYGPRGVAEMSFQNQDDVIVDLCSRGVLLKGNAIAPGRSLVGPGGAIRDLQGRNLNPNATWLQYRLRVRLLESGRVARHRPLSVPGKLQQMPPNAPILDSSLVSNPNLTPPVPPVFSSAARLVRETKMGGAVGTLDAGYLGGTADLNQQVSTPSYTLLLEGGAVRVGYAIPAPRLATVGGKPATQLHQDVAQEQISSIGGVPVFAATWRIGYSLPPGALARGLPMPLNPACPVVS